MISAESRETVNAGIVQGQKLWVWKYIRHVEVVVIKLILLE